MNMHNRANSIKPGRTTVGEKLRIGDTFPSVTLNLVGGSSVTLPDELESDFAVVLFYRGHW